MTGGSRPGAIRFELPLEVVDALIEEIVTTVIERLDEREAIGDGWPEWMSVETAARYLDVSEERVRKLAARRKLPYSQEGPGCRIFFRRADLDAVMEASRA